MGEVPFLEPTFESDVDQFVSQPSTTVEIGSSNEQSYNLLHSSTQQQYLQEQHQEQQHSMPSQQNENPHDLHQPVSFKNEQFDDQDGILKHFNDDQDDVEVVVITEEDVDVCTISSTIITSSSSHSPTPTPSSMANSIATSIDTILDDDDDDIELLTQSLVISPNQSAVDQPRITISGPPHNQSFADSITLSTHPSPDSSANGKSNSNTNLTHHNSTSSDPSSVKRRNSVRFAENIATPLTPPLEGEY